MRSAKDIEDRKLAVRQGFKEAFPIPFVPATVGGIVGFTGSLDHLHGAMIGFLLGLSFGSIIVSLLLLELRYGKEL